MRLYRQEWVDPKTGKTKRSENWTAEFTGARGEQRRVGCGHDKRAAAELGRKLQDLAEHQRARWVLRPDLLEWLGALPESMRDRLSKAGLLGSQATVATSPLSTLLDQFKESLRRHQRTEKHVRHVGRHVETAMQACGFRTLSDITSPAVDKYLATLRTGPDALSNKTTNHVLMSLKQFVAWAADNGMSPGDSLALVRPVDARLTPKHVRRALDLADLAKLIQTTHTSTVERYGLSGHARSLLYRLTVETGLRASEVRTLRVVSFADLGGARPTVSVLAKDAKNRKPAVQPLRADTAQALAAYFESRGAGPLMPAFPLARGWRPPVMIRRDLEAAGLPYRDQADRVSDFHSLRVCFVSRLIYSAASVKTVQQLARHATPDLTLNVYARLRPDDERNAVEGLESLAPTSAQETQAHGA